MQAIDSLAINEFNECSCVEFHTGTGGTAFKKMLCELLSKTILFEKSGTVTSKKQM
jgi:hypothetical protein